MSTHDTASTASNPVLAPDPATATASAPAVTPAVHGSRTRRPPGPRPTPGPAPATGAAGPSHAVRRPAPRRLIGSLVVAGLLATGVLSGAPAGAATGARAPSTGTGWNVPRLTVMPLGDSITQGVGSSTGDGYRAALRDGLAEHATEVDFVGSLRHGTHPDPDHEGHSGYRIDQIAAGIGPWLLAAAPNVVTLHLGSNDVNRDHQVAGAPERLAGLIDQLTTAAPDLTVLVAPLVPNSRPGVAPRVAAFNRELPRIVGERRDRGAKVVLVDFDALDDGDLKDGLHPNDSGYRKMARAFQAGVARAARAGLISERVTVDPVPAATGARSR
ncbi:SGNH/GDSL hydrolase family protein [Streptomyces sp. JNUCC 64]